MKKIVRWVKGRGPVWASGAGLMAMAGMASAQTTGSLSGLSNLASGLDTVDVIAGIIAFGGVVVAVNFARFGTRKTTNVVK